jgi:hypothetical protein
MSFVGLEDSPIHARFYTLLGSEAQLYSHLYTVSNFSTGPQGKKEPSIYHRYPRGFPKVSYMITQKICEVKRLRDARQAAPKAPLDAGLGPGASSVLRQTAAHSCHSHGIGHDLWITLE